MAEPAFSEVGTGLSTSPYKRRKLFTGTEPAGLFDGLQNGDEEEGGTGSLVNKNVQGMLTGDSYDDARTQERETLMRAAANLRAQSGAQVAAAGGIGQGVANKSQQGAEQTIFQGLADSELKSNIAEQEMKERGVKTALDIAKEQQSKSVQDEQLRMQKDTQYGYTDPVTGQRIRGSNELSEFGMTLQERQIAQQKEIAGMQIGSTEKIAFGQLGMDKAKLDETARQYNISTEQAADQFTQKLSMDYAQLSQQDKQFMASFGLDEQKFVATKDQFNRQLEQEGRIQMAQLSFQEKELAQNASQFVSRLDFDRWATQSGLDDRAAERVWQANENARAQTAQKDIALMQNDTERWKQTQIEKLTMAGWHIETARATADRTQQLTMFQQEQALTREIESGRLTLQESQMLQQANQFASELDFKKVAMQAGLDDAAAGRVWQTNERLSNQAYLATESTLDRQLQKDVEAGRISIEETKIANQAAQFTDQLAWQKKATKLGLDDAAANRVWQSAENAKDQVFQGQQRQLEMEFQAKGWDYQMLAGSMDSLPEEQVVQVLQQAAVNAGIKYAVTNDDGEPVLDNNGNQVFGYGFQQYSIPKSETSDIYDKWIANGKGNITGDSYKALTSNFKTLVEEGKAISDTYIESIDPNQWSTGKYQGDRSNRWILSDNAKTWVADNTGKLYQAANGRIYQIVGVSEPKDLNSRASIIFKDLQTGITINFQRGSTFPQ